MSSTVNMKRQSQTASEMQEKNGGAAAELRGSLVSLAR